MTSKPDLLPPESLPDEVARRAIREDLGTTVLVEAAAGTGKTESLVERMVALVATGTATVERLSAVTFTIKAASQLKQRFQNALEARLRNELDTPRRERLRGALARLDSCFIGTIHAFAARLLRERPVEAGVDPGFEEMDEPEDAVARLEAWERYKQSLFFKDSPHLQSLTALGVLLEDLRQTYEALCENSDVVPAVGTPRREPDFREARRAVETFLEQAAAEIPEETPRGGWTDFQAAVRRAGRLYSLFGVTRGRDFVRVLQVLRRGSSADGAGPLRKLFERLRQEVVKPSLAEWAEYAHPFVMPLLVEARDAYAAWRQENGRLNFQDLLLLARDLLRDHAEVRAALRRRFTPILVDEFQDTDPIQAEILFYLTGRETSERDWRKMTPLPGSLFVVGDPKQSIYRFRRADIETYDLVRTRIEACGRVLHLTANFRSRTALCEWVNAAFSRVFPSSSSPEQAAYVPLSPVRRGGPEAAAFRLETSVPGRAHEPLATADAGRIAAWIAGAVRRGERMPGDFLLLFRRRKYMSLYARTLEERGIPCEITGGGAFEDSEEIAALLPFLQTLADPDNPVPFLATLRGPLFGVDDQALYRFARAGGRLTFRSDAPEAAEPRILRACELLREAENIVESLPAGAAIARICGRLGWTAHAAASPLGESRAGNLLKALAAARTFSGEGMDFPQVVGELERMRKEGYIEEMTTEPGRPGVVRLMTLHGAKGLESPVVFLADPTGDTPGPRDYWIDRRPDPPQGHFRVVRHSGNFSEIEISRPAGWDAMKQQERRFDEQERLRLLYVGATRAKELLVVSLKGGDSGRVSGPWATLAPSLAERLSEPGIPPPPEPAASLDGVEGELAAFRERRADRLASCGRPSFSVVTVTELAHAAGAPPSWARTGRGMSWGRVLHRLLEGAMRDSSLDLRAYAANLLTEEERAPAEVEDVARMAETVRDSELWRRAVAARRRLVEVPFALEVAREEKLGLGESPPRTILQGTIDLVFEEEDGWTLVDYKSDTVTPENRPDLVRFYSPQIELYRRYWKRLTGRPTRAGLFFIQTGEDVWLRDEAERASG